MGTQIYYFQTDYQQYINDPETYLRYQPPLSLAQIILTGNINIKILFYRPNNDITFTTTCTRTYDRSSASSPTFTTPHFPDYNPGTPMIPGFYLSPIHHYFKPHPDIIAQNREGHYRSHHSYTNKLQVRIQTSKPCRWFFDNNLIFTNKMLIHPWQNSTWLIFVVTTIRIKEVNLKDKQAKVSW